MHVMSSCQQGAGLENGCAKDTMADCLRQLLEFDDGNRRATLESLSRYVAEKTVAEKTERTGESSSTESPSNSNDSADSSGSESSHTENDFRVSGPPGLAPPTAKRSITSQAAAAGSSGAESPHNEDTVKASIPQPPGLFSTNRRISTSHAAAPGQKLVDPPPGLENLKPSSAALDLSKANSGSAGKRGSRPGHQKHVPLDTKAETPTAAPKVEEKTDSLFALRKAFSDLTMDLPQEYASLAQNIFSSAAEHGEVNVQQTKQGMETLRWLRHYLEQQQAESVQKILGLMHLQEQVGLASRFPGAAQSKQWQQLPGQSQPFQAPGVPWMSPLSCPGSPSSTWGGAPASYFGMPQVPRCTQPGYPIQQQHTHETSAFKAASTNVGNRKPKMARVPATGRKEETLRTHLQELQNVDCNRIILARKINRLGFEAPEILQQHYSRFGKVERVLVAHSLVKAQDRRQPPRMRPSGLGFIVMSTAEEAQAILDLGEEQYVMNAEIRVRQFERRHVAQDEEEEQREGDMLVHL